MVGAVCADASVIHNTTRVHVNDASTSSAQFPARRRTAAAEVEWSREGAVRVGDNRERVVIVHAALATVTATSSQVSCRIDEASARTLCNGEAEKF